MRLEELNVIVTGAANGMGAHFARRLQAAGARVAAGDIDEQALAGLPHGIATRRLDVANENDCIDFVRWARQRLGPLNALVNNAGILRDGLLVRRDRTSGAIEKLAMTTWNEVVAVNLTGATVMAREVAAAILEGGAGGGVIVNMSSICRAGNRGQTNYVATKAALAANTVTWARELAPHGIRVGAIAPGMIETGMTRTMNPKARDALVGAVPLARIGTPEDVWLAVKFVIECDYFTGRTVEVDGGLAL